MRLLNTETLELRQFGVEETPPYAILSHRWGDDEVTFEDIVLKRHVLRRGFSKLRSFTGVAANDGFEYCWYRKATVCYAHLRDVRSREDPNVLGSSFRTSDWFNRCWTLQELVAPSIVYFFNSTWTRIGSRSSLIQSITEITGIDSDLFRTGNLDKYCAAQKMSWASKRKSSRIEDEAYSLLGLFGINMPLLYGEGSTAFRRLQEEILTRTGDYSILAHASEEPISQLRLFKPQTLASSAYSFSGSLKLHYQRNFLEEFSPAASNDVSITPRGVRLPMQLLKWRFFPMHIRAEIRDMEPVKSLMCLALLGCGTPDEDSVASILLQETSPGIYEKQRLKEHEDGFCMIDRDLIGKTELKTIILRHTIVRLPEKWSFDNRHHHVSLEFPPPEVLGFTLEKSYSHTGHISHTTYTGEVMSIKARTGRLDSPVLFMFSDGKGLRFTVSINTLSEAPFIDIRFSTAAGSIDVSNFNSLTEIQGFLSELGKEQAAGEHILTTLRGIEKDTIIELNAYRRQSGWCVRLEIPTNTRFISSSVASGAQTSDPMIGIVSSRDLPAASLHTWLGHVATEHYAAKYVKLRHELSDAAYFGHWSDIFERIEDGRRLYQESWVNAPRMSMPRPSFAVKSLLADHCVRSSIKEPISQIDKMSMWTPLHQAVYMNAPADVVQQLIDLGASRTLRTRRGINSSADPQLTPFELAQQMGRSHVLDLLRPSYKTPTPPEVLQKLENHFHSLIRFETGSFVEIGKLYLPVLEYLTELDGTAVWFPIQLDYTSAGYRYQLVGKELQVKSINIQGLDDEISYLITEDGISWVS